MSRNRFYEELLLKLSGLPGVVAASLSDGLPASGNGTRVFTVEGQSYGSSDDYPIAREGIISPDYFATFQTPMLQGRAFSTMDQKESLPVVIVNESFVRKFFAEGNVLGRRIRTGIQNDTSPWRTVVGVAPDMLMEGMRRFMTGAGPAGFYVPISQSDGSESIRITVRARGPTMTITPDVRMAVESLDPNLPVYEVMSMRGVIAKETWTYWVLGEMFIAFGFIALFIACVGLYSVMCYVVRRRVKELGIRFALGANRPDLVRLVMIRAVAQMGIGVVLGIALAVSAAGPLQVLLYDVDALDPAVFALVVLSLVVTGLLASFFPAHQITKLDPTMALTPE